MVPQGGVEQGPELGRLTDHAEFLPTCETQRCGYCLFPMDLLTEAGYFGDGVGGGITRTKSTVVGKTPLPGAWGSWEGQNWQPRMKIS